MHQVTILLAEDNKVVSDAVRDTLAAQGWRVEACHNGTQALRLIEGDLHFDALLLDNYLPGVSGLELTRRVRSLAHRRFIPVVIFSASEARLEAEHAGADAFLRKPEDVSRIALTLARLVADAAADRT